MSLDRRGFLKSLAVAGAGMFLPRSLTAQATRPAATQPVIPPPALWRNPPMARYPEKTDLILLTDRPPQLETPVKYFRTDLTPNDAFFVRWHLSGIPTSVDLGTFRLSVGGHVERPLSLSLDELKRDFEPVTLIAVAQCSGNSRGLFDLRVPGGQWGHGAVGNAKWTGVRLSDLLARAAAKPNPVDVSFGALDRSPMPDVPLFVKSLDFAHANDGEVMIAYAMNDAPLPMLNGFPLRLVVPGWYATYWVKSLCDITVLPEKFKGFWMEKAYRIANNDEARETPQQLATDTIPIHRHSVRSLFVVPDAPIQIPRGRAFEVQGVAFDAGDGIARVQISPDGGKTWADAALDADLGRYSWRRWRYLWTPREAGTCRLMVKATNTKGQTQSTSLWNRSGYQRNVVEHVDVTVT